MLKTNEAFTRDQMSTMGITKTPLNDGIKTNMSPEWHLIALSIPSTSTHTP